MYRNRLCAERQFFAELLSGLALNPQRLGRVWFASKPKGERAANFPRLDVVLRGVYDNPLLEAHPGIGEGEMLFIPPGAASAPRFSHPLMLLSLAFTPAWLGLAFYDYRKGDAGASGRTLELPHPQRGEEEAILMALGILSRSPQDQDIIQPLALSLLHWCRKMLNASPALPPSRPEFLYYSICRWLQDNYAQPLTRESVARFFNISANHLSRLFSEQGSMSFVDYLRWVRMVKARMLLQRYPLPIGEVAQRCGYPNSDYFSRVFRRQFGLTPGEYRARFSQASEM